LPARNPRRAISAIAATTHGNDDDVWLFRNGTIDGTEEPTGAPQLWQKRASGLNNASHCAQFRGSSDAPQLEQKRPLDLLPHDAQMISGAVGCVMRYNLHGAANIGR